jgi:hypothetical protein
MLQALFTALCGTASEMRDCTPASGDVQCQPSNATPLPDFGSAVSGQDIFRNFFRLESLVPRKTLGVYSNFGLTE